MPPSRSVHPTVGDTGAPDPLNGEDERRYPGAGSRPGSLGRPVSRGTVVGWLTSTGGGLRLGPCFSGPSFLDEKALLPFYRELGRLAGYGTETSPPAPGRLDHPGGRITGPLRGVEGDAEREVSTGLPVTLQRGRRSRSCESQESGSEALTRHGRDELRAERSYPLIAGTSLPSDCRSLRRRRSRTRFPGDLRTTVFRFRSTCID